MPLYDYRCPDGHTHTHLHRASDGDRPASRDCPTCGTPALYVIGAPARGIVTGSANPAGLHVPPSRDGFRVVEETDTMTVRMKGGGLSIVDYACTCGHTTDEVYDGDKPVPPPCQKCGAQMREVVGIPIVDWFTAEGFHATGGYFCQGLGTWITSREHRARVMAEQGVHDHEEDSSAQLERARKQAEIAEQDRVVYEMLTTPTPDTPEVRRMRDEGQIPDDSWAIADLQNKYGWR